MAMRWIPLDGKKEPDFGQKVLIIDPRMDWGEAFLSKTEHTIHGKQYTFSREDRPDVINATHYMLIETPAL